MSEGSNTPRPRPTSRPPAQPPAGVPAAVRPPSNAPGAMRPPSNAPGAARPPSSAGGLGGAAPVGRGSSAGTGFATSPGAPTGGKLPDGPPGYRLLSELGRGGMGVVYKARDERLGRDVALKVLLAGEHADVAHRQRFLDEAAAVGGLDHPNVVRVYQTGEHGGNPYLSLEFCPGGSLASRLGGKPQKPKQSAALMAKIAAGVQAAHAAGIIHRDLKPGNILLAADGTPKVADFGLAKRTGSDGATRTGAGMGTPAYMSPEQMNDAKRVGPASDLYALGAMLYEMLTGRPPFLAESEIHLMTQVLTEEPVAVRRLVPKVPADLETICHKCLAKDPQRRYASAADLADDLERFLRGEPIQARPAGQVERAVQWARRHPAWSAVIGVSVAAALLLAGGGVLVTRQIARERDAAQAAEADAKTQRDAVARERDSANKARDEAARERDAANEARDEARRQTELADERNRIAERAKTRLMRQNGIMLCRRGQLGRGLARLAAALASPGADDPAEREALRTVFGGWAASAVRLTAESKGTYQGDMKLFFPPGRPPVVAQTRYRGVLPVTDLDGRPMLNLRLSPLPNRPLPSVNAAALSPDGRILAVGGELPEVFLIDLATGQPAGRVTTYVRYIGQNYYIPNTCCLAFSRDGRLLAAGGWGNHAQVFTVPDGKPVSPPLIHDVGSNDVRAVEFSPDGRRLVTASEDGNVRVWDVATGKPITPVLKHDDYQDVVAAAFSPDGKWVLSGARDGTARLWDAETGKPVLEPIRHGVPVSAVAFGPDRRMLVTGTENGVVRLWEIAEPRAPEGPSDAPPPAPTVTLLAEAAAHQRWVTGLAVSDDGRTLRTWGLDGLLGVWRIDGLRPAPPLLTVPDAPANGVTDLAASPDGRHVATGCTSGRGYLWDAATGKRLQTFSIKAVGVELDSIAFTADGRVLTAAGGTMARLWTPDGKRLADWEDRETSRENWKGLAVVSKQKAAVAPDGSAFLNCRGFFAEVRELPSGNRLGTQIRHPMVITAAAWSPDGRSFATGAADSYVRIWRAASGEIGGGAEREFLDAGRVTALSFSPDGRVLGVGTDDGSARAWDPRTGTPLGDPVLAEAPVVGTVVLPGGRLLATASSDGRIQVWDSVAALPVSAGWSHPGVTSLSAGPDGRTLYSGGADGTVRVWRLPEPPPDDPAMLRTWVGAHTGVELDPATDRERRLSAAERLDRLRRLSSATAAPWFR